MKRITYQDRFLTVEHKAFRVRGKHVVITKEIRPDVVVIVPRLPNGKFLLERQYRHSLRKYIFEFPAGYLDPGEVPLHGAKRELEEELGYRASGMRLISSLYWLPGRSSQKYHFFLAGGLVRGIKNLDDTEIITSVQVDARKLNSMILSGKIADAKTIFAFMYYRMYAKGR